LLFRLPSAGKKGRNKKHCDKLSSSTKKQSFTNGPILDNQPGTEEMTQQEGEKENRFPRDERRGSECDSGPAAGCRVSVATSNIIVEVISRTGSCRIRDTQRATGSGKS
jgi:hypothetical protein